jgi:hypothetical protein
VSRDYSIQLPARRQLVKECAFSRLGLDVGRQARQSMIRRVRKGDVKYARKLTHSRTVIVLDHEGAERVFLYSSATKEIISFLGPDVPEIADWAKEQSTGQAAPSPLVRPVWLSRVRR